VDQKNSIDIHIHIDKTFSLDEARRALDYQKDVHPRGKIVLVIEK
jgi:NADPH:quinone reductase-like Zn-dependent oxidoreductase